MLNSVFGVGATSAALYGSSWAALSGIGRAFASLPEHAGGLSGLVCLHGVHLLLSSLELPCMQT